jgi:hypothetical protein
MGMLGKPKEPMLDREWRPRPEDRLSAIARTEPIAARQSLKALAYATALAWPALATNSSCFAGLPRRFTSAGSASDC